MRRNTVKQKNWLSKFNSLKNRIKGWFYRKRNPVLSKYTDEYSECFESLFNRAATTSGFNYLCTILRVEGITSGHWDAFVEAEEAAMDFSKLLRKMGKGQEKRALRMGLFLYSHSTEMSAPYEIIANLLRSCQDKPYKMYPFAHLVRVEKAWHIASLYLQEKAHPLMESQETQHFQTWYVPYEVLYLIDQALVFLMITVIINTESTLPKRRQRKLRCHLLGLYYPFLN